MANNPFTGFVDVTTRRKRREILSIAVQLLEQIRQAEEAYLERVPENFQLSEAYVATEEYVGFIADALDSLRDVYG